MYRRPGKPLRGGLIQLLFALLLVPLAVAACGGETHEFAGAVLEDGEPLPDFTLMSDAGPVSLSDFRGQYVFVYFGYTFCPDFCPTTMAKLATVHRDLGDDAGRMQVVMISVDPERDTPDKLATYAEAFNPTFIGITGTREEIDSTGEPYGLFYEIHEGSAATGYLVDHSTRTYLIGPDGRALVAYPHDAASDAILADLRWFLEQES